ncbi:MAG: hemerythrin domain-containing protein [Betaproteobacteria bacterium]|nr:MAG: hemerythrin domain-containing protein [Betaproteobacteria bacterium]
MDFQRRTNKRLYEEHVATLQLLARVERVFTGRAGAYPPAAEDTEWPAFARTLRSAIEIEVARHFEFEERDLFPRLEEAGDGDLAALLNEEHVTIRAVSQPLAGLLGRTLAGGLQTQEWQTMKTLALEFSERLGSHAQKEDGALLPLLENLLDEDTDRELFGAYAAG